MYLDVLCLTSWVFLINCSSTLSVLVLIKCFYWCFWVLSLHNNYIYRISSPFISSRLYQLHFCCVICSNLQFQAEEHGEEDKAETEKADGQADQPSEQSSLPRWVVELLTARYGTAALHSLWGQQRKNQKPGRALGMFGFVHDCNHLHWKMDRKRFCKMCSIIHNHCSFAWLHFCFCCCVSGYMSVFRKHLTLQLKHQFIFSGCLVCFTQAANSRGWKMKPKSKKLQCL